MLDLVASFADRRLHEARATIVRLLQAWAAEMVVKVKEPLAEEYGFLREPLALQHLHMAAAQN